MTLWGMLSGDLGHRGSSNFTAFSYTIYPNDKTEAGVVVLVKLYSVFPCFRGLHCLADLMIVELSGGSEPTTILTYGLI